MPCIIWNPGVLGDLQMDQSDIKFYLIYTHGQGCGLKTKWKEKFYFQQNMMELPHVQAQWMVFCTYKAVLGRGQPGLMRWILLWIMPPVQDRSLDLLTRSPARYYCTMDSSLYKHNIGQAMDGLALSWQQNSCHLLQHCTEFTAYFHYKTLRISHDHKGKNLDTLIISKFHRPHH